MCCRRLSIVRQMMTSGNTNDICTKSRFTFSPHSGNFDAVPAILLFANSVDRRLHLEPVILTWNQKQPVVAVATVPECKH